MEDQRDQRSEEGVKSAGNPLWNKGEILSLVFAACLELTEEVSLAFDYDLFKGANEAGLKIPIEPIEDSFG